MADERDTKVHEALQSANIGEEIPNFPSEFREAVAGKDQPGAPQSQSNSSDSDSLIGANVPIKSSINNENYEPKIGAAVPIHSAYKEETAAEIAAPRPILTRERDDDRERATGGTGIGTLALALSILSLFVLPILFGAVGIVLGFVARSRGAIGLGAWAIGIGAISIIIGIFITPFF